MLGIDQPCITPHAWNRRRRRRAMHPPPADWHPAPWRVATNRVVGERLRPIKINRRCAGVRPPSNAGGSRVLATCHRHPAGETLSNPVAGHPGGGPDTPNMRDGKDYRTGWWGFSEETTVAPITG
ncbi:hypothetical protein MARA_33840 [Mycolicibacterium arabiense]|uniref:Uncharacterized protein n=1 Tax=Mycolicibacterium arabiense TaxID=1286181 RepID=A0A7I7S0W7_9MYCO|nr:hypothetical protein MARA_33840 [Mycolicibacterium arabiense]